MNRRELSSRFPKSSSSMLISYLPTVCCWAAIPRRVLCALTCTFEICICCVLGGGTDVFCWFCYYRWGWVVARTLAVTRCLQVARIVWITLFTIGFVAYSSPTLSMTLWVSQVGGYFFVFCLTKKNISNFTLKLCYYFKNCFLFVFYNITYAVPSNWVDV